MIGRYRTAIYLKTGDDEAVDEEPDLIILCNPWCASDETFLGWQQKNNIDAIKSDVQKTSKICDHCITEIAKYR